MHGFCDSGKTISLVTQEDIQRVIDKAHLRVYGEERLARKERLKPLKDESSEPDWDAFDSPTYERKAPSQGGAARLFQWVLKKNFS